MAANDWITRQDHVDRALALLIFEAGQETGAVLAGVHYARIPFALTVEATAAAGVRLNLECEQPLPGEAEDALIAAVKRCTRGPLELTITQPRHTTGAFAHSPGIAIGVHTYSVRNSITVLGMPSDNLLGAKV